MGGGGGGSGWVHGVRYIHSPSTGGRGFTVVCRHAAGNLDGKVGLRHWGRGKRSLC